MFLQNPTLQFLLDIAHIDSYEHHKSMITVKMPKILYIADRHLEVIHEHIPIGQGNIDFKYIFTNILKDFHGKVVLEIVQSSIDMISSKARIEEYCGIR
ncbi:sugar phosphate isomerase/epimerase [Clostridium sp. FP2]|uniref:hypothetical protein n=1 Tax=Clostridium sp. FP2 TaxID=2724481 RepID=UPI0013E98487|nr:hypothetical protein [Clostridium sp. FP2]MBZ9623824.1 sugar phosphate isomerase/epimerase [Clostridium sp. FP2]